MTKNKMYKKKRQIIIISSFLFFFHFSQFIPRRRIGKRVSGKVWSAPLLWLSSSVSCLSQPIRCCGTAWSNQLHCEHGEWTEQPWPHILSLQPKLDHNPSTSLNNQLSFVFLFFFKVLFELNLQRQTMSKISKMKGVVLTMSPHRVTGFTDRKEPELQKNSVFI